jgi:hypothetical protein
MLLIRREEKRRGEESREDKRSTYEIENST